MRLILLLFALVFKDAATGFAVLTSKQKDASFNAAAEGKLKIENVDMVFTLSSGHIENLLDGLNQYGIRTIDVRHEQAVAVMAHAWSIYKNKPGGLLRHGRPRFYQRVSGQRAPGGPVRPASPAGRLQMYAAEHVDKTGVPFYGLYSSNRYKTGSAKLLETLEQQEKKLILVPGPDCQSTAGSGQADNGPGSRGIKWRQHMMCSL